MLRWVVNSSAFMVQERQVFTRREWILTIALTITVMVAGYAITSLIVVNPGARSQLNAGATLVSIVVGVLAIVYSYYQTFAQQRDSLIVTKQVNEMKEVMSDIKTSSSLLIGNVEKLNKIDTVLATVQHLADADNVHEASMKQLLESQDNIRAALASGIIQTSKVGRAAPQLEFDDLFSSISGGTGTALHLLAKFDGAVDYVDAHVAFFKTLPEDVQFLEGMFAGYEAALIDVLASLNFLRFPGKSRLSYVLGEGVKEDIAQYSLVSGTVPYLAQILAAIHKEG
jgi:hypothetical protein